MNVFGQGKSSSLLLLVAIVIIVFILFSRAQRQASGGLKRRSPFGSPLEPDGKAAHSQQSPDAMVQWEVEMHETARQLSARLDSKMGALEQLIHEADRAAARLEAALAAARPERSSAKTMTIDPEAAGQAAEERSLGPPPSQADALRSAGAVPAKPLVGDPTETTVPTRLADDRRYEEIYTLADYGLDTGEIAQRVGTPVGEVELILSLRNKR